MDRGNLGEFGGPIQAPAPGRTDLGGDGKELHLTLCWTGRSISLAGNDVGPVDISNPVHPAVAGDWSDLSLEIEGPNGREIGIRSTHGAVARIAG